MRLTAISFHAALTVTARCVHRLKVHGAMLGFIKNHQDVRQLEIAVDNALLMGMLDRPGRQRRPATAALSRTRAAASGCSSWTNLLTCKPSRSYSAGWRTVSERWMSESDGSKPN
jgi:hypothetical protein